MRFRDRTEAGRRLAELLVTALVGAVEPLVLALPRGGVPVAAEVAAALGGQLEVLVAHKIGAPGNPELAIGALAEDGEPVWYYEGLDRFRLTPDHLAPAVAATREELRRRVELYRGGRPLPSVAGRTCVVVDDGLATGLTMRAAVRWLRAQQPGRIVVAVPVAAPDSLAAIGSDARAIAVLTPPLFEAVGSWYRDFEQVSDAEVLAALHGE